MAQAANIVQSALSLERSVRHDAPAGWISTPLGAFCIFFPEDAHAPLVSACSIRKVTFKIVLE